MEVLKRKMEELRAAKEKEAEQAIQKRYAVLDRAIAELGIAPGPAGDAEVITMLRNRNISDEKAKRIPETTLKQLKWVLYRGCSAPDAAKAFKLSLATVHTYKSKWEFTNRKDVKRMSVGAALREMPEKWDGKVDRPEKAEKSRRR